MDAQAPNIQQSIALAQAQQSIQEIYDSVLEAERRRREIGYAIDQYSAQTSSQPR